MAEPSGYAGANIIVGLITEDFHDDVSEAIEGRLTECKAMEEDV